CVKRAVVLFAVGPDRKRRTGIGVVEESRPGMGRLNLASRVHIGWYVQFSGHAEQDVAAGAADDVVEQGVTVAVDVNVVDKRGFAARDRTVAAGNVAAGIHVQRGIAGGAVPGNRAIGRG